MYIDAYHDKKRDVIHVVERVNGKRIFKKYDARYVLYYDHPSGTHRTIFGDCVKKFETNDGKKFRAKVEELKNQNKKLFESDIHPYLRCLEDNYTGCETPELNITYYDIEVNWDEVKGYAPVTNPFNSINAVTIYNKWEGNNGLITLSVVPPTMTIDEAKELVNDIPNVYICENELELLDTFLGLLTDTDVLIGYNSTYYDLPYIINRLKYLGKEQELKRLCLFETYPKLREVIRFGKKQITYELIGMQSFDWLEALRKHYPQQLASYKLDFVGELLVGENKVQYDGTLDTLYKSDFRKFIEYSRKDVTLIDKLEDKRKLLALSNQVAHSNLVLLKHTLGTVITSETAVINACHSLLNMVVPDKKYKKNDDDDHDDEEDLPVVGAYVTDPKKGLHDNVGACDITSLYPSVIRTFNCSVETLIGHIRSIDTDELINSRIRNGVDRAEAWDGLFHTLEYGYIINKTEELITIDFEDGKSITNTGKYWYEYIFNPENNICITANGTLFRNDIEGIFPKILSNWFNERKELQKLEKEWDAKEISATTDEEREIAKYWKTFYNSRSGAKKVNLNGFYGSILAKTFRFYDQRLGKSVTLTGRSIIRHVSAKINEQICGTYDYVGDAIVAGDTDSSFFVIDSLKNNENFKDFEWTKENIIELYEAIVEDVNLSFPIFLNENFNIPLEKGKLIKTGLDLVASKSLFIKKKKYACLCYYYDGHRRDINGKNGYLKIMGLDIKRSDTPKYIQEWLSDLLVDTLTDVPKYVIMDKIKKFRTEFKTKPGWEKGSPKRVNALSSFDDKLKSSNKKVLVPGHVRAALNYNKLIDHYRDNHSIKIEDGGKILVFKLRSNVFGMTSVAFPVDQTYIPYWFKELPFSHEEMENTLLDMKLDNLLGVLNYDFTSTIERDDDELFKFS